VTPCCATTARSGAPLRSPPERGSPMGAPASAAAAGRSVRTRIAAAAQGGPTARRPRVGAGPLKAARLGGVRRARAQISAISEPA
jgi:hypothetical protein